MYKISIIIATYNAGKTLKQALGSIRQQTYNNIETIIVDGKSNDETVKIVRDNKDIVDYFVSEKDRGIYDAFNKGVNIATGDFIYFLGADDCLIATDTIESVVKHITNGRKVLSFPVIAVDEESCTEYVVENKKNIEQLLSGNMIPHQGLFVKRDIMKKYKFDLRYKIVSDYDFLVRYILDGGEIDFFDEKVAYYSEGGVSSNRFGSKNWKRFVFEHFVVIDNHSLAEKYLDASIDTVLFENTSRLVFFSKGMIRQIIGDFKMVRNLYKKVYKKRHSCKLEVCRWCKKGWDI